MNRQTYNYECSNGHGSYGYTAPLKACPMFRLGEPCEGTLQEVTEVGVDSLLNGGKGRPKRASR